MFLLRKYITLLPYPPQTHTWKIQIYHINFPKNRPVGKHNYWSLECPPPLSKPNPQGKYSGPPYVRNIFIYPLCQMGGWTLWKKKESTFVGRVFVMHCLKLNIQYLFNKEYLIPNGQYSIKTIILITYEKM